MQQKTFRYFVGDFETTVFQGQEYTEVWASASVEMFTEDVKIFTSIEDQFDYFVSLKQNICVYYHNLKFDGNFWLSFLMFTKKFKQACRPTGDREIDIEFIKDTCMKNNTYKYSISDMGQWYTITIKVNGYFIVIRDSLKLLPFSVRKIGKSFGTKHKKTEIEYEGIRYSGCEITKQEREYIANDVLVVKEALEIMFEQGHTKLTIGSCCLAEYRKLIGQKTFEKYFPDLSQVELNYNTYGYTDADRYIRRSYRGGWCYVVEGKQGKIHNNGLTADVNSLYPSVMHSESGNYYPIGTPTFWKGNMIPPEALICNRYYFIRVRTRFYIKENMLPFIQIKNNMLYKPNECLKTSDIYSKIKGTYLREFINLDGEIEQARPEMVLTMTDYALLKDHYKLEDFEILDGCWFETKIGIFDVYIDKYKKIKMNSKGAIRELAKLFLNNLYGKMASSNNSSFKYCVPKEDGTFTFWQIDEHNKKVGYIPVGSAITSYARNFTIRTAQANYYGVEKRGFIYADTDSIHCDLTPEELNGVKIHDTDFCCWKLEGYWDRAIFTRQKTYIEHITHTDGEELDNPYHLVKCAGMPDKCKDLFIKSLTGYYYEQCEDYNIRQLEYNKLKPEEKVFVNEKREMEDFKVGLIVPSKLRPKRIKGGVVLVDTTYEMR